MGGGAPAAQPMGGLPARTAGAALLKAQSPGSAPPPPFPAAGRFRGGPRGAWRRFRSARRHRHHELHAGHGQPHPGHRQEAPGAAARRPDADRVPAQHRPVRKLGAAPDCGAYPRGQEVWGHPPRHLRRERRERRPAGGNCK